MAVSDPEWARFDSAANILTLHLHVQTGAKHTESAGIHGDRLKIRLAAAPVAGKANAVLRAFLADAFAVPQRSVELTLGLTSRKKTVRILSPKSRLEHDWAQDSGDIP